MSTAQAQQYQCTFGTMKQALAKLQCNQSDLLLATAAGRHMQAGHMLALPRSRHAIVGIWKCIAKTQFVAIR